MAFRVIYDDDESRLEDFGDDSRYWFNDHGLLVVESDQQRRTYSPRAWVYVEEERADGSMHVF